MGQPEPEDPRPGMHASERDRRDEAVRDDERADAAGDPSFVAHRPGGDWSRDLTEGVPHPTWIVDPDGSTDHVNGRWCEYTGHAPGEVLGATWISALHPEDRGRMQGRWEQAVAEGCEFGSFSRLRRRDGSDRWQLVRGSPLRREDGRDPRWIVTCTEVDDLWRSQEALHDSEARFRLALSNTSICLSQQDANLRYTWYCNPQGGNTDTSMLGRRDEDLMPEADARVLSAMKRRVLGSGVGERAEVRVTLEGRERYWDAIVEPWRDRMGRVDGVAVAAFEVTERRRVEEALRASEGVFRAVFEGAGEAIVLADDSGRYIAANPTADRLFGVPDGGLVGRSISEFTPPGLDFPTAWRDFLREGYQDGGFHLVREDHTGRDVEFDARAHILPGHHLSVMRDVTERKRMEEARDRYAARLETLRSLDRAILAARSPEEIAESALQHLARLLPFEAGSVLLCDPEGHPSRVLAGWGPTGPPAADSTPDGGESAGPSEPRPRRDASATGLARGPTVGDEPDPLRAAGYESFLRVPMRSEGRMIGLLCLGSSRPSAYPPQAVEVAADAADLLAIAVHQSVLFQEIRSTKEQLEAISRRLIRAEEDERRRIARELHDDTGQALTAIKLNLRAALHDPGAPSAAPRLEEALMLAERTIQQVREISLDLRPSLLDDLGLVQALRSYSRSMAERLAIAVDFRADPTIDRVDPEVATACYRVAQEAMNNVAKHASASLIRVQLIRSGTDLGLLIEDDGIGCDIDAVTARAARGSSLGVLTMVERATLLGGRVVLDSLPGRGTRVSATFPIGP